MKLRMPDKYSLAAFSLLLAGALFIAFPLVTNTGDTSTAAFVIAGMVCVMTGSFVVTLSAGESMDPRIVGMLPAQGSLTLCRLFSDLGIHGNAHFLPRRYTGETRVMQLNPASPYDRSRIPDEQVLPAAGPQGLVTIPSGDLLREDLEKRQTVVLPNRPEELTVLLNETIADMFEFVSTVSADWNGSRVTIVLHDYQFTEECRTISTKSRTSCTQCPCPVASLCGVLIAEGLNEIVTLEQCSCEPSSRDVTIIIRLNSLLNINA